MSSLIYSFVWREDYLSDVACPPSEISQKVHDYLVVYFPADGRYFDSDVAWDCLDCYTNIQTALESCFFWLGDGYADWIVSYIHCYFADVFEDDRFLAHIPKCLALIYSA